MSKNGVVILVIAALVFGALGFVVGQVVVAAGNYPGSLSDPAATEGYVDTALNQYVSDLQNQIDELKIMIGNQPGNNGGTQTGEDGGENTTQHVKVTGDGINVRNAAATGGVITQVNSGLELEYIESVTANNATWYKIRLSNGTEGYIHSDYCSDPY